MTDEYQAKYGALTHEQLYQQLMSGDPDQVDAVAAKISSLRDTLGSLQDSLQGDLAGLAKSWSSDSGTEYQRRVGLIGSFVASLHTDLDSVHTTLTGWSGLLREAKKHAENPAATDGNGDTVKDAAIGAAVGAPLGPLGMAAGGLIGGFMGHNQDEEERQKAHERMITLVATLAANYVTSDRMPGVAAEPDSEMPSDASGAANWGPAVHPTATPAGTGPTGNGSVPGQPVVDPTRADGVTSLAGAGDQTGDTGGTDSLATGGVTGTTGSLLRPGTIAAAGLGVAAAGAAVLGANGLPLTGANLANAEASGGVGRPGNLFSGVRGEGVDEGALGINRGTGAAAGRTTGEDEDEVHRTWLTEDEMVWGNDQPNAPAVLGAEPPAEPTEPR